MNRVHVVSLTHCLVCRGRPVRVCRAHPRTPIALCLRHWLQHWRLAHRRRDEGAQGRLFPFEHAEEQSA